MAAKGEIVTGVTGDIANATGTNTLTGKGPNMSTEASVTKVKGLVVPAEGLQVNHLTNKRPGTKISNTQG